jgi:anti-sigma factor RsiW
MSTEHVEDRIDAYLDGELDPVRSVEVERHLDGCPACRRLQEDGRSLQALVRSGATYFAASPALRERLLAALGPTGRRASRAPRFEWTSLQVAAAVLLAALGGSSLTWWSLRTTAQDALRDAVVSSHVRGTQAEGHLLDVPSSDRHTVKPWFSGKLDFAPTAPELAAEGFDLAGGRLDYAARRPIAVLVYRRHQHVISLFQWSAAGGAVEPLTVESSSGYTVVHWADGQLAYWAVSDLDRQELESFARSVRKRVSDSR